MKGEEKMRNRMTLITIVLLAAVALVLVAGSVTGQVTYSGPELTQTTVTLTAVADATVRSWQPNTNFGSEDILELSYSAIDEVREAVTLLRFDVASALPANAIIDSAILELFLMYGAGADPVAVAAYFVTSGWAESSVTWNSFPTAEPIGIVSQVDASPGSYKSWVVTSFAQAWHSDSNNGLYLRGPVDGTYYERTFESRQHNESVPRLVVTYHLPTLSGRVYAGNVGDESTPLSGVTVELYCSNNADFLGEHIGSAATNAEGWYGLLVAGVCEFYNILETDLPGYEAVGATTVDGVVVNSNWIQYTHPLEGKTLTGNKFWDRPVATPTHTPTSTPTATRTPTRTPTATPGPGLDLQVEHVELTQAIQCKDNPSCPDNAVPLISGKHTYVRVYVKVLGSSATVPNVSARVTAKMPWGDYTTNPINSTITAKLNPQRSQFNDTLNFHLPAWAVSNSGALEVTVNPDRTLAETNYANNKKTVNLTFVATPPLIVVPIWIDYNYGGTLQVVDGTMPYNMSYYLGNILPVGEVQLYILPGPVVEWKQQIGPGGASWGAILGKLTDMRKKNPSVPASAHWYAMLPFKAVQGYAGLGAMPGKVATGRVPVHHENFEDGADIMAHELGHNFNRQHAPCGVSPSDPNYPYPNARLGDFGWDPQVAGGGKVLSWPGGWVVPATSFDVMSYCQDEWISEYTYRAILNYRGSSPATAAMPADYKRATEWKPPQWSEEELRPYLFASGTIAGEGAELVPWSIMGRPVGFDDGPGEGPYRLRLVAGNDETLFERHFDVETYMPSWVPGTPAVETEGANNETFSFYEILPWHPETTLIQVWHGESSLAERDVSEHSPTVQLVSPQSDDLWVSDGEYVIEWRAQDGDGDPLWFDVAFSRDGGATWDVFATRLEETHLAVRGDQFPGTDSAMLRVYASDGVHTSEITSGPFVIEPKPPMVVIVAPHEGAGLPPGIPVRFKGYAYDREDGILNSEAMSWSSNRDGWLGDRADLMIESLSPGWHTITLRAADSDEQIGLARVNIFVGHRIYLPIVLKSYP